MLAKIRKITNSAKLRITYYIDLTSALNITYAGLVMAITSQLAQISKKNEQSLIWLLILFICQLME